MKLQIKINNDWTDFIGTVERLNTSEEYTKIVLDSLETELFAFEAEKYKNMKIMEQIPGCNPFENPDDIYPRTSVKFGYYVRIPRDIAVQVL